MRPTDAQSPAKDRLRLAHGLAAGTLVLTLDGEMPVEHLTPGDRVITRDTGMAVLRGLDCSQCRAEPVRVKAGSLGHARPEGDVILGAGTRIHLRDWRAGAIFGAPRATVPAERLIDGEFIAREPKQEMRLYALTFDHEHIIYAGGLEIAF